MSESVGPKAFRLSSDFDGTLIQTVRKTDWRNWFKAGIPLVDGVLDFLDGTEAGGLSTGDVISRRNETFRLGTTKHSIDTLGLGRFFSHEQLRLMGSEEAKAGEVERQRQEGPLVMPDDKIHKLGKEILVHTKNYEERPENPLILAAVSHRQRDKRVDDFLGAAEGMGYTVEARGTGMLVVEANVHVLPLEPYSFNEGERLAAFALSAVA